jgi:hypothetical protein
MLIMLTAYFIVVFSALKIRKLIRNAAMSQFTRRLNADMDKTLIALVSSQSLYYVLELTRIF